jgi:hypothetical protein
MKPIRGRPRLFTDAQCQMIAAEWNAGQPLKVLAAKYGAEERTIWNYIHVHVPRGTNSIHQHPRHNIAHESA